MTWKNWTRPKSTRAFDHTRFGRMEAWTEHSYDAETGILSYRNGYRVLDSGKEYSAPAQIRYTPLDAVAAMVDAAGLAVDQWLGDWKGNPYEPTARDIIPLGRLA